MADVENVLPMRGKETPPAPKTADSAKASPVRNFTRRSIQIIKHVWHIIEKAFSNWWLLEIASLLISIASLTVLMVTLKHQDGQYPGNWEHSITFNTFVVVLSTISRITLLLPVTSAISQIRWLYFRKGRSLFHFQALDAASRGPWGSAILLLRVRSPLAIGCAVVIVVAVAFESFTQQSVKTVIPSYVPVLTVFGNATGTFLIPVSDGILPIQDFAAGIAAALEPDSISNVYDLEFDDISGGLGNLRTAPSNTLDACNKCYGDSSDGYFCICDTPPYATIDICGVCEDLSENLSQNWYDNDTECIASLPSGLRLDSAHDLVVFSAHDYLSDVPENRTMLSKFEFIGLLVEEYEVDYFNGSASTTEIQYGFNAGSCSAWVCGSIMQLFYRPAIPDVDDDGQPEVYFEGILASIDRSSSIGSSPLLRPNETVIEIVIPNGTSLSTNNLDEEFDEPIQSGLTMKEWNSTMPALSIPFSVVQEFRAYLFSMHNFTLSRSVGETVPNLTNLPEYFQRQAGFDIWSTFAGFLTGYEDLIEFAEYDHSVNIQMTNWLRTWVGGSAPYGYENSAFPAYTHVRWEWMILPWILEAMTVVLLAYTIGLTHRSGAPVWKANALASMFHGVHLEDADASVIGDVVAMESRAKKEEVQFSSTAQGYRLVKVAGKNV